MKKIKIAIYLFMMMGLLLNCSTQPQPGQSPISVLPVPDVSPVETPSVVVAFEFSGPHFEIDEPLITGATRITGKGPANVPIVIVNVTMSAKPLGSGIISSNGTFAIGISEPVVANHRIGIVAGMMGGTPEPSSIDEYIESLKPFSGNGFMNLPYIGVIFASALVEAQ